MHTYTYTSVHTNVVRMYVRTQKGFLRLHTSSYSYKNLYISTYLHQWYTHTHIHTHTHHTYA